MGEMLQSILVLEDSLCLNGQLLAMCAVHISNPSQLCSFSAQPCQQLWGDCWAGAAGGSPRELMKPALLTEECLLNQALSVLKLCLGILSS